MLDRELDKFWENDEKAHRDNCFAVESQIAFGIRMSDECVFWELGEEGEPWGYTPRERRLDLNRRYNDKAEKIVGRRLLREELPPEDAAFPYVKRIGEVFGSEYALENGTEWLKKSIFDEEQLEQVLDRVEKLDLREFMLPPNWESEKKRIYEKYGLLPPRMHWVRGPVTLACSLMGTTEFLYFLADEDELAERFSSVMADVIIKMAEIMDEEAGRTGADERGFGFADDNCCLLSPALYKKFGYPVLKKVFARFSPDEGDERFQHSDSAMGHLLPLLGEMNLTGCNFGPTVLVPEIRKYLPKTRIDGCIAPFTFMHNDEKQLTYETLRDIEAGKQYGGVNIWTAGSINNGSSLKSMRLMMDLVWDNQR
ncbi:MAG: hypothetical protein IK056_02610 [Clostridia bacterium]|nr:hypothetical protein [Clostridia bacterium]MBR6007960.1 hypothetical protein [Clostridia bacterium]